MAIPVSAPSSIGGFKFFLFTFGTILFAIVFFNSISESIQQKSFTPFINEMGSRFLLSTQILQEASDKIIQSHGVFNTIDSTTTKSWKVILAFSDIFFAFLVMWSWIQVLMFIISRSFVSTRDAWFTNFFLSLMFFLFIEIFFIVGNAAINKEINSVSDIGNCMLIPFNAFYSLIKAIPYILSPVTEVINKYENYTV